MAGDNESRGQQYNFDTGDLLESSEGWWKARGRAAETAANDLHALIEQVDPIFRKNHWGDCVEGRATHELFRGIVDTWVLDLRDQAASAHNLAKSCYAAARTISAADSEAADKIQSYS
ncbi:hypothetical protein GII33_14530 [Gordonia pseudamarae]|jgi:hypothetical protein|uniref:Excreted virulence factor EspC, type VII ESX diderm n=1 Tax=Gordonia pseudamarae TaxID=2831662 RepID=A0ABX6IJ10_9ACTN|nr:MULTISPECIES: hypothetical protein [Gordonia]MBD0023916.1 hypothetical protein [Gordonia sp. (in: high G+C Gram-positive bacteria)]QHN26988.1 hypothetical protein GII33_14530 [Gordonia pseudamarae]QHN35877.1 hypothetical protein GII31_14355 [Gordonia pseudamarae]